MYDTEGSLEDKESFISAELGAQGMQNGTTETGQLTKHNSITEIAADDQSLIDSLSSDKGASDVISTDAATITDSSQQEFVAAEPVSKFCDSPAYDTVDNNQSTQRNLPNAILPLLRFQQYDSSESSSRYLIIY